MNRGLQILEEHLMNGMLSVNKHQQNELMI